MDEICILSKKWHKIQIVLNHDLDFGAHQESQKVSVSGSVIKVIGLVSGLSAEAVSLTLL